MISRVLLTTIIALIAFTSLSYSTDVSGDVWGEWTAAGNPYRVVGDLRVPPDSSLVIGPGCYIEFQGYYQLLVDASAKLMAIGSETDSISLTGGDSGYQWAGVNFNSADSGSQIAYCKLSGCSADDVIYCLNSILFISNSIFDNPGSENIISIVSSPMTFIENNVFYGNSTAINIAGCINVEITGNTFKNCNNTQIIIIEGYSLNTLIRGNEFYNNDNSIIFTSFSPGAIIEENAIYDNNCVVSWFFLAGDSIIFDNNIIFNNDCPDYYGIGIFICVDTKLVAFNNTISCNSGYRLGYFGQEFTGPPSFLYNNIMWGNNYSAMSLFELNLIDLYLTYCDIQGDWPGIGNIDTDPLFIDTANGDFHLLPGSPCIDAGDPASPLDPDSTRADMGALYFDQTTGIKLPPIIPHEITLYQNYPNPFNANTKISFVIPVASNVTVNIFDMLGRRVRTLLDNQLQAGEYSVAWDGRSNSGEPMSSGVYFYNIKTTGFEESKKMVILK
jgi:hypothetical protein